MVHYIRFLTAPKLHAVGVIKVLITITTDLGDDFFHCDRPLRAGLFSNSSNTTELLQSRSILWKAGMRVLWVEIFAHVSPGLRLRVEAESEAKTTCSDTIALDRMPLVIGCCSNLDPLQESGVCGRSERSLLLQPENCLRIDEDIGESIARHVWWVSYLITIESLTVIGMLELPSLLSLRIYDIETLSQGRRRSAIF